MRANEVKETREVVVRTEYIAEDGTVFKNEEECKKYEESALFAISKELKRLTKDNTFQSEINDSFSYDDTVEIFDVQTERDLENLRRYLYLKARNNGAPESSVNDCFKSTGGKRNSYVFSNVTYGHEVMVFWDYDEQWFWVYGDGSIENIRQKILARPHLDDIMFRYYKGEILVVSREAHRKDTHIEWEKIV